MAAKTKCPSCSATLKTEGLREGKTVRCPKCDHRFALTAAPAAPLAVPPSPPAPPPVQMQPAPAAARKGVPVLAMLAALVGVAAIAAGGIYFVTRQGDRPAGPPGTAPKPEPGNVVANGPGPQDPTAPAVVNVNQAGGDSAASVSAGGGPVDLSRPVYLHGHRTGVPIAWMAYSPDGTRLATMSLSGDLILWNLASGSGTLLARGDNSETNPAKSFSVGVPCLAFSLDGQTLFSGSLGGVHLWDVASASGQVTFPIGGRAVPAGSLGLVISPDRKRLILEHLDESGSLIGYQIWDVPSRKVWMTIKSPNLQNPWGEFRFSPDSKTLVALLDRRAIINQQFHVFNLEEKRELPPIREEGFKNVTFLNNTQVLTTGGYPGKLSIWDLGDRRGQAKLVSRDDFQGTGVVRGEEAFGGSQIISPDGKTVAVSITRGNASTRPGDYFSGIALIDIQTQKEQALVSHAALPLVWTPDGRTMVSSVDNSSGTTGAIVLMEANAATGERRAVFEVPFEGQIAVQTDVFGGAPRELVLAASPTNSSTVAVGLGNGTVAIYPLPGADDSLKEVATMPYEPQKVVVYSDKPAALQPVTPEELRNSHQIKLEFSHDGRYLSALGDRNKVWDVAGRKLVLDHRFIRSFENAGGPPPAHSFVAVFPEHDLVISGDKDSGSGRYSLSSGRLQEFLKLPVSDLPEQTICEQIHISPDGKTAVGLLKHHKQGRLSSQEVAVIDPLTLTSRQELTTDDKPLAERGRFEGKFAFSPDGKLLAAVTSRETEIFELPAGRRRPSTATGSAGSWVAFVEGGARLAVYDHPNTVDFYDLNNGQKVHVLEVTRQHNSVVSALAFTPHKSFCAAVNSDGEIVLHDLKTGGVRQRRHGHSGRIISAAISPDGKLLATVGADRLIKFWDVSSVPAEKPPLTPQLVKVTLPSAPGGKIEPAELAAFPMDFGAGAETVPLAIAAGGKVIAAHNPGESLLYFLDPAKPQKQPTTVSAQAVSWHFPLTADGRYLVGPSTGGSVTAVTDTASGKQFDAAEESPLLAEECSALAPDGKTLAVGVAAEESTSAKLLYLLDVPSLKTRREGVDSLGKIEHLAYSLDGAQLAAAVRIPTGCRLLLIDPQTAAVRKTLATYGDARAFTMLTFAPDGRGLAAGVDGSDGSGRTTHLVWWDLTTGQLRNEIEAGAAGILAYVHGGRALAAEVENTMNEYDNIRVFDVATGEFQSRVTEQEELEQCGTAIAPARSLYLTAYTSGEIKLWDLLNGQVVARLKAHNGSVRGLALSPDEKFLVTAGQDNHLRLWALDGKKP